MGVVCELEVTPSATVTVATAADVDVGDYAVYVVAATGTDVEAISESEGFLTVLATGSRSDLQVTVFGGFVPDPVPASVEFASVNSAVWAAVAKFVRGVDTSDPVSASAVDSDFASPASLALSVGPITIENNNSYLMYCLAANPPTSLTFEAGPTPTILEQQLGRTVGGIGSPIEVGIWAQTVNSGTSSTYAQTVTSTAGTINGLAALICLRPTCLE